MKQLQNNFTTPEQSKRLLELGIPEDSSDCFYINDEYTPHVRDELYERNTGYKFPFSEEGFAPCWSVGRLIEIYITCIEHYTGDERLTFGQDTVRLGMIDCIIAAIEVGCDDGDIDFSKLEEQRV